MANNFYVIKEDSKNKTGEDMYYIVQGNSIAEGKRITETLGRNAFKSKYKVKFTNLANEINNL